MIQLIESLICLHENLIFFDSNEFKLTEERIYLNLMCSECYLDPGFINYSNEKKSTNNINMTIINGKISSDIFSLGIIFLRLISFLSNENIEILLSKKNLETNEEKNKLKNLFQKKKKNKFGDDFTSSFNIQNFNEIESKIFSEIYKCDAHDEIKKIVFEMLRLNEKKPKLKDSLIRLKTLKGIFEKQDVEGIIATLNQSNYKIEENEKKENNTNELIDIQLTNQISKLKKTEESFNLVGFLSDVDLRPYFQTFLSLEFAQEPLLFLIVVEKYKLQKEERSKLVEEIYNDYINSQTAKFEINVTHRLKKLFLKDMNQQIKNNEFKDDLFDGLLNHVVGRSLQEPFLRYKNSEKFRELKKKYM